MADRREPRGDAVLRAFARDLAKMRRDLRNLEAANQISSASIEGGTLDVYDDADVLRERIGKQANGSYGRLVLEGPVPPTPSEPDVQVIADGVVAITWDGRCEEKWPFVDFEAVRVHLVEDPVAEVCDRDNQVGAIFAARGGTIVAVTESDDDNPVYVRLVAVSSAGHTSDPSPAVLVDELDEDDLSEEDEELEWEDGDGHSLTSDDITAGTVTFGLSHDPEVESLLAWWHPGGLTFAGVPQTRGVDFTVDFEAATVTWTLTSGEKVGDRLRVYYPYMSDGAKIISIDGTSHWDLPVTPTPTADAGNQIILMVALRTGYGVTDLNGYTALGESDPVTFDGADPATPITYRLALFTLTAPGGPVPVPTFDATPAGADAPWVMAALNGATSINSAAFSTSANTTSAGTPTLANTGLRVWALMSDGEHISAPGVVVAENNPPRDTARRNNINMVLSADEGTAAATAEGTGCWMTASIAVTY